MQVAYQLREVSASFVGLGRTTADPESTEWREIGVTLPSWLALVWVRLPLPHSSPHPEASRRSMKGGEPVLIDPLPLSWGATGNLASSESES
jgi:hypothetical protein